MSMPTAGSPEPGAGGDTAPERHERERRAQAQQPRPRMNVQQIHSWVDVEIQQALRRGEFENLPGAGKPLKDVDSSDPDWWVKSLIEREKLDMSAALPTVLALRQERRGFPESLAGISNEVAVRERLADYNARVIEDRRKPVVGPNSPAIAGRVDVEEMVAAWRQLRVDRERRIVDDSSESVAVDDPASTRPDGRHNSSLWILLALVGVVAVAIAVWLAS